MMYNRIIFVHCTVTTSRSSSFIKRMFVIFLLLAWLSFCCTSQLYNPSKGKIKSNKLTKKKNSNKKYPALVRMYSGTLLYYPNAATPIFMTTFRITQVRRKQGCVLLLNCRKPFPLFLEDRTFHIPTTVQQSDCMAVILLYL